MTMRVNVSLPFASMNEPTKSGSKDCELVLDMNDGDHDVAIPGHPEGEGPKVSYEVRDNGKMIIVQEDGAYRAKDSFFRRVVLNALPQEMKNLDTPAAPSPQDEVTSHALVSVNDAIIATARKGKKTVLIRRTPPKATLDTAIGPLAASGFELDEIRSIPAPSQLQAADFVLKSTYGGTGFLPQGTQFANIIGSSPDPKIDKSWIQLWKNSTGNYGNPRCASHDTYSDKNRPGKCRGNCIGGHVIQGRVAQSVGTGVSHLAFIVPICKNHNNNDNVYMTVVDPAGVEIVWLDNYML